MQRSRLFRIFIHHHHRRNASTISIPALVDSYPIEATLFQSPIASPDPICIVVSQATGSRRQFYNSFATHLCEKHHFDVITYDYRGTNERRSTPWTLVEHWARRDCAGVLSYGFQNYGHVVHVGHSLGGNLHALLPPSINQQISRILLVASANSYLMYHKWNPAFLRTLLSLYVIREPLTRLYGYYPLRTLLRSGVDMPANIIRQWARWTRHRQCFVDDHGHDLLDGFHSVQCPMFALSFADDEYYTRQAFDIFTDQFHRSSHVQRCHAPKGGHFGFFKHFPSSSLEPEVVRFLRSGVSNLSTSASR